MKIYLVTKNKYLKLGFEKGDKEKLKSTGKDDQEYTYNSDTVCNGQVIKMFKL